MKKLLCLFVMLTLPLWAQSALPGGSDHAMPSVGSTVPDWSLPDIEGRKVSPNQYRGKVLVLNFFAFWCDTWKEELVRFKALRASHPELQFEMVFVAVDSRERSSAEPLMHRQGVHFPLVVDRKGEVSREYGITTVPTLFIIDPQGVIRASYQGHPGNRLLARDLKTASGSPGRAGRLEPAALKEFLLPEELGFWRAINAERSKRGLAELELDTALTEVGREYLQRSASEPLKHATGRQSPETRVRARGVGFRKLGENLARSRGFRQALQSMLESPSHKTNLLHPRSRRVGVSAFRDPQANMFSYSLLFVEP